MKKGTIYLIAAVALALAGQANAVDADKAKALAKSKNCFTCHSIDKKLVGPAYKDVAKKFKDDPNAVAELSKKVINGSSGVWGSIPMPPNPVSQEEAKTLVQWILTL